jgi:cytochrome c556
MQSKTILGFAVGVAISLGVVASEDEFDPKPVIEGRQAALRDIGAAFKGINDEFKKSQPALGMIRQYARQIDELSKEQQFWFPPGTGPESDIETLARPAIWQQPTQFKAGQVAMSEHAGKLAKVASGEDLGAIRAQWQALGKTCKGCHDKFREEDE